MDNVFKSGHQSEQDPFEFVLSDESVDRMGDVIRADSWKLKDFKNNPVCLFAHDHSLPIGVWKNVRVENKRLLGTLQLAKAGTSEFIDTVRSLIEQRILKAVSVGFGPEEATPRKNGGYEFTKSILHEVSVCSVPANPSALALAKAISPEVATKLFDQSVTPVGDDRTGRLTHTSSTPNLDAARVLAKAMGIN